MLQCLQIIGMLKNKTLLLCLVFLLVGIAIGIIVPIDLYKSTPKNTIDLSNLSSEFHSGGYKFINPLYECNTSQTYGEQKLGKLQSTIQSYISQITKQNTRIKASLVKHNKQRSSRDEERRLGMMKKYIN